MHGTPFRLVSDFFGGLASRIHADVVHGVPIITFSRTPALDWQLVAKRVLDILGASIGLILCSPCLL